MHIQLSIKKRYAVLIPILLCAVLFQGCRGGYSFSNTSISPEVKTVSINYINNMAQNVFPTLSNSVTEALKDKFTRNTRLDLIDEDGDLHFEGEITNYDVVSIGVQANEIAATNRLTITIKIRFTNTIDNTQSYDKSFSGYEDFSSSIAIDDVQSQLVDEIVEKLVEDIFNNAVANW